MELRDRKAYVKPWEERVCSWGAECNSFWLEHHSVRVIINKVRVLGRNFVKKFKTYLLGYGESINMRMSLSDCILEKNYLREVG